MKDSKYSKAAKPSSLKGAFRARSGLSWTKFECNIGLIILAGILALIVLLCGDIVHISSSFLSKTPDWDEQRAAWMNEHPTLRPEDQRPKILMVTGSSHQPCQPDFSAYVTLKSAKNKLDYCRLHDIPLYYSLSNRDLEFKTDWWVTLPVIRMLMLQHPKVDWIWWVDPDAIFTDLSLEPPLPELKDQNLVLHLDGQKSWTGVHSGHYLIRNCQWSLHLIDSWESGDENLAKWTSNFGLVGGEKLMSVIDEHQSAVAADPLQAQDVVHKAREVENWTVVAPKLEVLHVKGGAPLVTHFSGCLPCSSASPCFDNLSRSSQKEPGKFCLQQLDRAFVFAENQVYERYGFQARALGSPKTEPLTRYATEATVQGVDEKMLEHTTDLEYSMLPRVTDWDTQRQARLENIPAPITGDIKKMLVTGSPPKPCAHGFGPDHLLLRGMKNKIDYCRLHGIEIFYNMAVVDKDLIGWWTKLPLLRTLMLGHPEVEWFWWMDSDAIITDMAFEIPWVNRYKDYNLVMYGSNKFVYEEKKYVGINTGDFFIRNCQGSIDLLDKWASFALTEEMQKETGEVLSNFLSDRKKGWFADDQSVLVYVMIKEREKWGEKILLEDTFLDLSGNWQYWTHKFADIDLEPKQYKPFVTHFAGCSPCRMDVTEECLMEMDRAFNYADNQLLKPNGLCHEHLTSKKIINTVHRSARNP